MILFVIIFAVIAFGVCLPNLDRGKGYAVGFYVSLIMISGMLGALR